MEKQMSYFKHEPITYENKYGKVDTVPASEVMPVNQFRARDYKDFSFSFEDAEKITLVTENKHCQIAADWKSGIKDSACVLFIHTASNTGFIAKVVKSTCNVSNAAEKIAELNKREIRYELF
jgi:hypothetical protein